MSPDKQEQIQGTCAYITGSVGLGATHCIDFTQGWHFAVGALSTILIILQAAHDIPKSIRRFKAWLKRERE